MRQELHDIFKMDCRHRHPRKYHSELLDHIQRPRQRRAGHGEGHSGDGETDRRIADGALAAIRWLTTVPEDEIRIAVAGGELILHGTVQNLSQKRVAEEVVGKQPGVRKVRNRLQVKQEAEPVILCSEPMPLSHWQTDCFTELYDGSD